MFKSGTLSDYIFFNIGNIGNSFAFRAVYSGNQTIITSMHSQCDFQQYDLLFSGQF